jgi:hypothetical protein
VLTHYNEELYRNFKGLALNSRHCKVPDTYEDSLPSVYLTKHTKPVTTGNRAVGTPRFEWEEGVKEDAVIRPRCRNWKLTMQIGTVWRQKLREAKG